jgi:hypothetical protein
MAPISCLTGYKACILLEQLQEGAYTFQFIGINDLESTVQDFQERAILESQGFGLSEYLIFQHVPYNTFVQLSDNESSPTFYCRSLYIHDSQILRLKVPTGRTHDIAAGEFAKILTLKFGEMHAGNQFYSQALGLIKMRNISKEADGSWGPAGEDYVTCILEVGASESVHHLVLDAHLWLESEGSYVSQAITMNIAHDQPNIIIQLWEARTRQLRSVRSDRPWEAFKTEEVQVSLINNVPTESGCLRLSFEKILERPPRPDTSEGDIIFTTGDLTAIARQVWRRQNLIPREMARAG